MLVRGFSCWLVAVLLAGSARCTEDESGAQSSRKRFLSIANLLSQLEQRRPLSNGISKMANIMVNGMQTGSGVLQGGLDTAVHQVNDLTHMVQDQVSGAIESASHLMISSMEMISYPSLAMATSLALSRLSSHLKATGMDVQRLPPIGTRLWGFGSFQTSEGRLSSLSSLRQSAPIRVNMTGMAIRVDVPTTFAELSVFYPEYTFSTWGLSLRGNITAKVADNGLVIHLLLLTTRGCSVNVESVEMVRFQGIDLQISGLCSYCSSIASSVANVLQDRIRTQVQTAIDDGLKQVFKEDKGLICSKPS